MGHDVNLGYATTQAEIFDALDRAVTGIDDQDVELFKSSNFTGEGTYFEVAGANKIDGADALLNYMVDKIIPLSTFHQIGSVRLKHRDGESTAQMTAHAVAYHYRPEEAFQADRTAFTTAGLYNIALVLDGHENTWK